MPQALARGLHVRILYVYRPVFPSYRAQHIQTLHSAVALAQRGHEVTIFANPDPTKPWNPPSIPSLHIEFSPFNQPGLSSLWFQWKCIRWLQGPSGWIIARDKRRLLRLTKFIPGRHRIALESHEVDSLHNPHLDWRSIEADLLRRITVLICNCGGTQQLWQQEHHPLPPTFVVHNATSLSSPASCSITPIIRSFGSHHDYKAADWLAGAVPTLPFDIEVFGSWNSTVPPPANLTINAPVSAQQFATMIHSSQALLLCLGDNIFGQYLSSPLKLWDYLASDRPIIAPSLASVQEIINKMQATGINYYQPNDTEDFLHACQSAFHAPARVPSIRTWEDRALEVERILRRFA